MRKYLKKAELVFRFFGKPQLFAFSLIWLIVLTVLGTVAQSSIGLLQAQNIFFSSYIYWLGDLLPTPGGYTTLGVIFLSLISNLIFATKWKMTKIGVITVHVGALLLLFGGLITAIYNQEGSLVIPPNATIDFFSDYHKMELAIIDQSGVENKTITFSQDFLKEGKILKAEGISLEIEILNFFNNTRIKQRDSAISDSGFKGFATVFDLQEAPSSGESDKNQAGIIFRLRGADPGQDGIYAIFEEMPLPQTVVFNGIKILFQIRKARTILPFQLKLLGFEKMYYPGTTLAKSFKSKVLLIEGDVNQRALIEMNSPLRHRGYTIYQSSFHEDANGDTTILVVVKNAGAIFPYISSVIMCLGLLIHLVVKIPRRKTDVTV